MLIAKIVLATFLLVPVHDMSDPDGTWYRGLIVPGEPGTPLAGSSCCSGGGDPAGDCRNVETRIRNGHWEAYIDSKTFPDIEGKPLLGKAPNAWVRVPDDVIIRGSNNPTGRPVACYFAGTIRCFVEGTET